MSDWIRLGGDRKMYPCPASGRGNLTNNNYQIVNSKSKIINPFMRVAQNIYTLANNCKNQHEQNLELFTESLLQHL